MRKLDSTGLNWEEYEIDLPEFVGRAKAVKVGDIDGDGVPDIVHSTKKSGDKYKIGIVWLSAKHEATDPDWEWHEFSGP